MTHKEPNLPEIRKANKSQVATFFDVSLPTVESWIRKGCPVQERGSRGVGWTLDLRAVAQWLYDGHREQGTVDPDSLPAGERKAWYDAEKTKRGMAIDAGELVPKVEMEQAVSTAFAAVTQDLLSIPDHLERLHGLSPEVSAKVDAAICGALDALRTKMEKLAPELAE